MNVEVESDIQKRVALSMVAVVQLAGFKLHYFVIRHKGHFRHFSIVAMEVRAHGKAHPFGILGSSVSANRSGVGPDSSKGAGRYLSNPPGSRARTAQAELNRRTGHPRCVSVSPAITESASPNC